MTEAAPMTTLLIRERAHMYTEMPISLAFCAPSRLNDGGHA